MSKKPRSTVAPRAAAAPATAIMTSTPPPSAHADQPLKGCKALGERTGACAQRALDTRSRIAFDNPCADYGRHHRSDSQIHRAGGGGVAGEHRSRRRSHGQPQGVACEGARGEGRGSSSRFSRNFGKASGRPSPHGRGVSPRRMDTDVMS